MLWSRAHGKLSRASHVQLVKVCAEMSSEGLPLTLVKSRKGSGASPERYVTGGAVARRVAV